LVYHFDIKKYGETLTRPDIRITPIRDSYTRLVKTVLEARQVDVSDDLSGELLLRPGEVAFILDGGKTGNRKRLLAPWLASKSKDKKDDDAEDDDDDLEGATPANTTVPTKLLIVKDEESLQAWRDKARSTTLGIKQSETVHILTHNRLALPERPRKHYPGSNCGDCLAGVKVPPPTSVWHLTWKEKKALYGKRMLIAVGGRTEGVPANAHTVVSKRSDNAKEPVCYHPMPKEFYEDTVLRGFFAKQVFDLSTCDEELMYTCLEQKIGYVGICFTQAHAELLEKRCKERLRADMADIKHPLYHLPHNIYIYIIYIYIYIPLLAAIGSQSCLHNEPSMTCHITGLRAANDTGKYTMFGPRPGKINIILTNHAKFVVLGAGNSLTRFVYQ
jgi:hypothetical protein